MALVGIATFIAGVVMLVRAKRVLPHSSQPPLTGTDLNEMVDKGVKRTPLGAGVYEEVDKEATQTDGHSRHYQEQTWQRWRGANGIPLRCNQIVHEVNSFILQIIVSVLLFS